MKGRDPMKGRHSVSVQKTSTGKWPGSSAEPASNKGGGITGVARSSPSRMMQPKPGVLANQAKTSSDLQARLQGRAPEPFANRGEAATAPTPASPRGAKPGGESVANPRGVYAGKSGATVAVRALPNASAVGYRGGTAPTSGNNQVISGRTGSQQLARKTGDNAFQKVKRNASFYGE